MPIFITQGRYSRDAIKGMIANPEDRAEAASKLFEAAGGKLLAYYVTLGEYDWLIVSEFPDHQSVSAAVLAAAASGGVTDVKTTCGHDDRRGEGGLRRHGQGGRGLPRPRRRHLRHPRRGGQDWRDIESAPPGKLSGTCRVARYHASASDH